MVFYIVKLLPLNYFKVLSKSHQPQNDGFIVGKDPIITIS